MRIIVSIDTDTFVGDDGLDPAAASLAELLRAGHEVVIVHGAPAETQAVTGSRLVRALDSVLVGRTVVALVTHAQVGAHDPQVSVPDRPRVRPQAVPEAQVVRELLADGTVVVCGGGIPVIRERGTARLRTVPVTVDPDRTAALLAVELDADIMLFLTGATHLFAAGGHGRPRPLLRLTPDELSGVRLPEAVITRAAIAADFVTRTGGVAAIGPVDNALGILLGTTGTQIRPAPASVRETAPSSD
ncbi:hypothetical protein ABZX65_05800 [Streptomyces sp. NPDC003300]|uniref:amino acid kinase family protein n=1 Tax=unclassified Streptomyces TaxID=2593676 RepID=UPI0033B3D172